MLQQSTVEQILNIPVISTVFSDPAVLRKYALNLSEQDFQEAVNNKSFSRNSFINAVADLERLMVNNDQVREIEQLSIFIDELINLRSDYPIESFRDLLMSAKTVHFEILGRILATTIDFVKIDKVGDQIVTQVLETVTNPAMIIDHVAEHRAWLGVALLGIILSTDDLQLSNASSATMNSVSAQSLKVPGSPLNKVRNKVSKMISSPHLRAPSNGKSGGYKEMEMFQYERSLGNYVYNISPLGGDMLTIIDGVFRKNGQGERTLRVYTIDSDSLLEYFGNRHHSITKEAHEALFDEGLTVTYNRPTDQVVVPRDLVDKIVERFEELIKQEFHKVALNYGDAKFLKTPGTVDEALDQFIVEQFVHQGTTCTHDIIIERDNNLRWLQSLGFDSIARSVAPGSTNQTGSAMSFYRANRIRKHLLGHSSKLNSYSKPVTIVL